jgi:4-hydroxy-tetrahydrodipicolinate synthase
MFEQLKERLQGCFYTVFTPFDEAENIDFESIEKYITLLYRQGARRFYVMAYNSRYSQLMHQEIRELNEFTIKTVKALDRNNIAIVGDPIHCSTRESTEFARHAKEAGADLISLIVREKYFTDEQIIEHYAQVGQDSDFPILVHEMPFLSGYDGKQMYWPESLMLGLLSVPEIIALKEDAHDFDATCAALALEPRIRIIIAGRKSTLLNYRDYGARAYLNGISILDAEIGERFWKAFEEDDEVEMRFIVEKLEAPFFDLCVSKYGWHRVNKAFLQAAGHMHRRDRMPLKHLSDEEFVLVETVVGEVLVAWDHHREETK